MGREKLLLAIIVTGLCAGAVNGRAQDTVDPYIRGSAAFDYEQWPAGTYGGSFRAAGDAFGQEGTEPGTFDEAVGGFRVTADDTTSVAWYAAVRNTDQTVDLAVLWVRAAGDRILPGDYPVDPADLTAVFAFLDDVMDFDFPIEPTVESLRLWIVGLAADFVMLGYEGTIHLDQADAGLLEGTFTGRMTDGGFPTADVSAGEFRLEGVGVPNATAAWGDVKAIFR
jgi:hypothetical protein